MPRRGPSDGSQLATTEADGTAGADSAGLLVLLHGAEDQPADVLAWAAEVDPERRYRAVALTAPFPARSGPVWFRSTPRGPSVDDLANALVQIDATVASLVRERGPARRRVVFAGFSQGGAMALMAAVDPRTGVARGAASVCGWLPDVEGWEPQPAVAPSPVLLLVGATGDDVVPADFSEAAALTLAAGGHDVTSLAIEGGHEASPEALSALRSWLVRL